MLAAILNKPFVLASAPPKSPDIRRDPLKKIGDFQFPPDDRDPLTTLDNFLIRRAGKIGEALQNFTGSSQKDVIRNVHAAGTFALRATPFLMILADSTPEPPAVTSPLVEENYFLSQGQSPHKARTQRLGHIFYSAFFFTDALLAAYFLDGPSFTPFKELLCFEMGLMGLGTGLWGYAEYLARAQLPKPPKKTYFEKWSDKAKETLSDALSPQPELVPVPVPVRPGRGRRPGR